MLTVITGAPGAGKTSLLVSILAELEQGRTVYASGIPDLAIPHVELDDPRQWPELVEDGAIVCIDEAQRIWRPTGSAAKVPPDIELLETHRHRGLDFYILTQQPGLIHRNVRLLCGRHLHIRDTGFWGRWLYEWPELVTDPGVKYKSAPIKRRYKLPKKVFGLYKSASLHVKPQRGFPVVAAVLGVSLLVLPVLVWRAYTSVAGKLSPEVAAPASAASAASAPGPAVVASAPGAAAPAAVAAPAGPPVVIADARPVMPVSLGGCWIDHRGCSCILMAPEPRVVLDLGMVCVRAARGEYAPHPSKPRPTRTEPDPMRRDAPGAVAPGPAIAASAVSV